MRMRKGPPAAPATTRPITDYDVKLLTLAGESSALWDKYGIWDPYETGLPENFDREDYDRRAETIRVMLADLLDMTDPDARHFVDDWIQGEPMQSGYFFRWFDRMVCGPGDDPEYALPIWFDRVEAEIARRRGDDID